ncbi:Hydrogenase maturation protein, carbamoyltransferase HypF [Persephonella hydrogeniphila]|uniref:Carbamoyltransferase n=1 Tax=Persephonella hydrogeniphila TaxID=198703 RepID=A0A285NBQ5_9AQUI|nr:carbamoyltransferase HypF [Persephonella hydrogeniphila]SNZ06924.1 Hydrogenase maturation protein, carbamoyltransferase HypF [Persephonella hydrogeniphila]
MKKHIKIHITGAVQGVGFRPFVYNLAKKLGLKGYVINDTHGVVIEVEGKEKEINRFLISLQTEKPPLAHIFSQEIEELPLSDFKDFQIKKSEQTGKKEVFILPDISTCTECLKELTDPEDRRYRYPFINCTNCGPRFTIIERLPYDRPNITMKKFKMCPSCEKEYKDPNNRRFHAQPNACPVCGPYISLYTSDGKLVSERDKALEECINLLNEGKIIAVKGIGGFHLVCDATNNNTIETLRNRKKRGEKPFAIMFKDIEQIKQYADITDFEEAVILSPEKPIVIVRKKENTDLSSKVAPDLDRIGVFLPYSPLHFLLLKDYGRPLVMTSANLSDEPIVKENEEAFEKLSIFTDYILVHNRDIKNRVDDSVVRVINKKISFIRRSRGFAPLPVKLPFKLNRKVLAVGGHQKNTIAIGFDDKGFLSQHIGDLETADACRNFEEIVYSFFELYDFSPELVISDLHPLYHSTKWAKDFSEKNNIPLFQIQHHYAHTLSLMAENQIKDEKIFALSWDGTGYGEDGNLWGGEFLVADYEGYERIFHFDYFRLIGGEKAIKEPRRVALSILFEIFGKNLPDMPTVRAFKEKEIGIFYKMWEKGINSPLSSSTGRLFDAAASILGIRQILSYEGQSGMIMENFYRWDVNDCYSFEIKNGIDWRPIFVEMIQDRSDISVKVSKFINTLACIAIESYQQKGEGMKLGLTGGVFQNKFLTEKIVQLSEKENIPVILHKKVPPNDGGLSLGQLVYRIKSF